jgi:hypothetical protein
MRKDTWNQKSRKESKAALFEKQGEVGWEDYTVAKIGSYWLLKNKKRYQGYKTIRDARVTIAHINQGGVLHETSKVIQMKMNARSRSRGRK